MDKLVTEPKKAEPVVETLVTDNQAHLEKQLEEQPVKPVRFDLGWRKLLRIYVIPLVTLLIFAGILISLIIPALGTMLSKVDQLDSINEQIENINSQIVAAQQLDAQSENLENSLEYVNTTVPTGTTAVVDYQQRITQLANDHNLTVGEIVTAEQIVNSDDAESSFAALVTVEIPSTYNITGSFSDIKGFIEDINTLEDFVIIGEMKLRSAEQVSIDNLNGLQDLPWSLLITLVKYQYLPIEREGTVEEVYVQVPLTSIPDQEILDFIESKYE